MGVENDSFWSGNRVRIWRTGRHTLTKNCQVSPPPPASPLRRMILADSLENYYQCFTPHTTLPVVLFGFCFSPAESTNSEQQRQKEAANTPPQIGMTARVTESSPGQLPMLHNQQIAEMLGSSLVPLVSGSLRNGEISVSALTFLYCLRSFRQSSVR